MLSSRLYRHRAGFQQEYEYRAQSAYEFQYCFSHLYSTSNANNFIGKGLSCFTVI